MVYVREREKKLKKLHYLTIQQSWKKWHKMAQAFEVIIRFIDPTNLYLLLNTWILYIIQVSSHLSSNTLNNHRCYELQQLWDLVGSWLATKRQGHPPQRQQPLQPSGPGTSQRGGLVMGRRREEVDLYLILSWGFRIRHSLLFPAEEKKMLKELLARIANLEQKKWSQRRKTSIVWAWDRRTEA